MVPDDDTSRDEQALAAAQIQMGSIVANKYRLDHVIGAGGMGIVAAAHHIELEQPVALKFLLVGDPRHRDEFVVRFKREAKVASMVQSEHVVRVMDVGTTSSGIPFIVMELLEGEDLDAFLTRQGTVEQTLAVDLILQACAALAEAHAADVVHRDIKPANLFLTRRRDGSPSIKILDFGISKANEREGAQSITGTNTTMGSPTHMAPEQWISAKSVDHRSDVWSLGTVLFELLTGKLAFDGTTMPEICQKVLNQEPVYPDDISVAPGLAAVIARCLEKAPEDRYDHVGALAAALYAFAGRQGQIAADQAIGAIEVSGRFTMTGVSPLTAPLGSPVGARDIGKTRPGGGMLESRGPAEAITGQNHNADRKRQWDGDTAMSTTTSVVRRPSRARWGLLLGLAATAGIGVGLGIWRSHGSTAEAPVGNAATQVAPAPPPPEDSSTPPPAPSPSAADGEVVEPPESTARPKLAGPSASAPTRPVVRPRPVVKPRPVRPPPLPVPPKPKPDNTAFDDY